MDESDEDVQNNPIINELKCPILSTLMQNPMMITKCGHTFEKSIITQILNKRGQCPIDRKKATVNDLQINYLAKNLIIVHKQQLSRKLKVDYAEKQLFKFDVIILGDAGVGKTSLIKQFVDNQFNSKQQSTTKVQTSIAKLQVDNKLVHFHFSDIGGSKQYVNKIKEQLKYKFGILLVYSITDYKSFLNLKIWLKLIEQYAMKNIPIIIMANKHDLAIIQNKNSDKDKDKHRDNLNQDREKRDVSRSQGDQFAKTNNLSHYQCSSKSFNQIKLVFHKLAKQIIKKVNKKQIQIKQQNKVSKKLNLQNPQKQTPQILLDSSDIRLVIKNIEKQKNYKKSENINQIIQQGNTCDIIKVINQYYEQALLKIDKNKNNIYKIDQIRMPQFEYKINKKMSQHELKQIIKKVFMFFKLQTNEKKFQIIKEQDYIQIIKENCMIQWRFDNILFKFGQYKLKQKKNRRFNGFGLRIVDGEMIYTGNFKNNKKHGKGKQCYSNGSSYQGDWKDDKYDGKGKSNNANGLTYSGDYKYGKQHGKGKFCLADGSNYQGDFRNNFANGKGKYCSADGSTYEGDWKDGVWHGNGIRCLYDGSIFQGEYKNNKIHGKGKMCDADGSTYQGDFKDNRKNGKGKMVSPDGSTYQGDFMDNQIHGQGKLSLPDGTTYQGDFRNNQRYGKGKYCSEDGSTYQGNWKDDKIHGKGKFCSADGSTYQGAWKDGNKHGQGKLILKNGNQLYQLWQYGRNIASIQNKKKQKINYNRFKCDKCLII